jgi:hypothetical protein
VVNFKWQRRLRQRRRSFAANSSLPYAREDGQVRAVAHERARVAEAAELAERVRAALDSTSRAAQEAEAGRAALAAELEEARAAVAEAAHATGGALGRLGAAEAEAARGALVRGVCVGFADVLSSPALCLPPVTAPLLPPLSCAAS